MLALCPPPGGVALLQVRGPVRLVLHPVASRCSHARSGQRPREGGGGCVQLLRCVALWRSCPQPGPEGRGSSV